MPVFAQAIFNVVHRAAHPLAGGAALPETDGQRHFRKLGAHAQQRRAPHPEHRTRPADGDGTRHARDVAGAHRRRQRRADRLKRRHGAVRSVLLAKHASDRCFDGIGELADLQKAGPHTEQQPHADDADHGWDAPDKMVDRIVHGRNGFDHGSFHTSEKSTSAAGCFPANIVVILSHLCSSVNFSRRRRDFFIFSDSNVTNQ